MRKEKKVRSIIFGSRYSGKYPNDKDYITLLKYMDKINRKGKIYDYEKEFGKYTRN